MKQSHRILLGSLGTFSLFALGTVTTVPGAVAAAPEAGACTGAHASETAAAGQSIAKRKEAARQAALAFIAQDQ
jgi:hypothetical protein